MARRAPTPTFPSCQNQILQSLHQSNPHQMCSTTYLIYQNHNIKLPCIKTHLISLIILTKQALIHKHASITLLLSKLILTTTNTLKNNSRMPKSGSTPLEWFHGYHITNNKPLTFNKQAILTYMHIYIKQRV